MRTSKVRALATILFCLGIFVASSSVARATMSSACYWWDVNTTLPDWFYCQVGPTNWSWTGQYDISSYGEEAPSMAAYICDDIIFGCYESCESEDFKQYLSWMNSGGPCGEWPEWCWITWGNPSCQQGATGSFSCTCGYFNQCIC